MEKQTNKLGPYARACLLLFPLVFLSALNVYAETKVREDSITLPAESLPEFKTDPHVRESQGSQISGVVRRMFQDKGGNFWFATQNGVGRSDGTTLVYFDIKDEFGSGVTGTAIDEDRDGNVWLGTTRGVTKYDGESFTNFTKEDGLSSTSVWSLFVDSKGTVWVGTLDGPCRFDGDRFTPFPLPPAPENDPNRGIASRTMVTGISEDRAGNLWFASAGSVFKYGGETLSKVSVMDQQSNTYVNSVLEDRNGNVWFATQYKGLIRFDGEDFSNVTQQEELAGTEVYDLYEDSAGHIWFSAEHAGVYCYDGDSFTHFTKEDGIGSNGVFCIMEDKDGRMWFGGWFGAYRYDGKSFVNVTREGPW